MTLRRWTVAMTLVCGLCVWGVAQGIDLPSDEPIPVDGDAGGTHDDAAARYRNNQSNHWRHVAVGNYSSDR